MTQAAISYIYETYVVYIATRADTHDSLNPKQQKTDKVEPTVHDRLSCRTFTIRLLHNYKTFFEFGTCVG